MKLPASAPAKPVCWQIHNYRGFTAGSIIFGFNLMGFTK
jgi:hypothetical protein